MKTIVSSKGQIVIPAELRKRDRVRTGQRFEVERLDAGQYLLKRESLPDNKGVVDWLLGCPGKGWFQAVASEPTAAYAGQAKTHSAASRKFLTDVPFMAFLLA